MKQYIRLVKSISKLPTEVNIRFYSKFSQKFASKRNSVAPRSPSTDSSYIPVEQTLFELFQKHAPAEEKMYDNVDVKVQGVLDAPTPIKDLKEANFAPTILFNASKVGITRLTPIQKHSFPIVELGKDIMACSQTGSGKTLAFLLPMLNSIIQSKVMKRHKVLPVGIIIAPTRELANQIYDECRKFSSGTKVKSCVAFGGVSINSQINQIQRGCDILIGTPGRIKDLLLRGITSLSGVKYVVLDEADRMLDMGFEKDIRGILSDEFEIPSASQRTTLLFSATFPDSIRHLAQDFLKDDHFFISVGRVGGTTDLIDQQFVRSRPFEKIEKLEEIIQNGQKTLIFVNSKVDANSLEETLSKRHRVTSIHGDKSQRQRDIALFEFKNQKVDILVATDVASRGLDINDIELVVNYELPKEIDSYVHRIGRTGRKGKTGKAISLVSQFDPVLKDLMELLQQNKDTEIPSWLSGFVENKRPQKTFGSQRNSFRSERNSYKKRDNFQSNRKDNFRSRSNKEDKYDSERISYNARRGKY
eukprot:gene2358-2826_t